MSRTTLSLITAIVLTVASLTLLVTRQQVLGDQVKVPLGPGTWRVTLLATGKCAGEVRAMTLTPLDFGRQHILKESCKSEELLDRPPDARHPNRRQVIWTRRAGVGDVPFRARYEFYCSVNSPRPTTPMTEVAHRAYAAPVAGQYLQHQPGVETDHVGIAERARQLTAGIERGEDRAEALFRFVDQQIRNEPTITGPTATAAQCLANGNGDSLAKARLLTALCRNRGVPARIVTGLPLTRGNKQVAHFWVETWLNEQWLPMCPFSHHFGWVPRTYLILGFGEQPIVRGRNVRNLNYAFLVERAGLENAGSQPPPSLARRLFTLLSFHSLPPAEQRLVEFLLLLPVAALIVCVFRNLIGLASFGTFAPALLGLSFRELRSMPGILVFTAIVLTGWMMRRLLDRYHLLQVPRMAVMLSLVVLLLIGAIVTAAHESLPATKYVSLFPMVILVGMIERFWTLETEDGAGSSFRTLLETMAIVAAISLVLSLHALVRHLFLYPETLGIIIAAQIAIGRYTGYRLLELYRFRDFSRMQSVSV